MSFHRVICSMLLMVAVASVSACSDSAAPADATSGRDGARDGADDDAKDVGSPDSPRLDGSDDAPSDGGVADADSAGDVAPFDAAPATDCAKIANCLQSCPPSDTSCLQGCLGAGTPVGLQRFNTMAACISGALSGACATPCQSGTAAQCDSCVQSACATEVGICYGTIIAPDGGLPSDGGADAGDGGATDGGSADLGPPLSCGDILNCIDNCPPFDQLCAGGCISRGSATGRQQFSVLNTCVSNAIANACQSDCVIPASNQCQNCIVTNCNNELLGCQ